MISFFYLLTNSVYCPLFEARDFCKGLRVCALSFVSNFYISSLDVHESISFTCSKGTLLSKLQTFAKDGVRMDHNAPGNCVSTNIENAGINSML